MNGSIMRIDFNSETRQILAAGTDFAIRIWGVDDLRARVCVYIWNTSLGNMRKIHYFVIFISATFEVFSTQCYFLISGLAFNSHWFQHTLTGHSDKVATARFNADGTKVISGSHDRTIRIWDLSTRKCKMSLRVFLIAYRCSYL